MSGPPVDRSRAFRPSENFAKVEGLSERVMPLIEATRFRSALQPILAVLSDDPGNEHALRLAIVVFSASRTAQREAAEPVTLKEWNDARLDTIFAECSQCRAVTWVPDLYLFITPQNANVVNPAGMQCHACGYVLCRACMRKAPTASRLFAEGDVELSRIRCPGCRELMDPFVYPTGRARRELRKPGARITHVLVFRSGPVTPDAAALEELLNAVCSQAIEDEARIRAIPMFPWPERIQDVVVFHVLGAIDRGELPQDALENALTTQFVDSDKNPGYLMAITEPLFASQYEAARRAMAERRFRDAVPLLQSVIRSVPGAALPYSDLGFAQINSGQLAAAFETLAHSLTLEETPETYCNLGMAHIIAGNPELAIEQLEKALALQPDFQNAKVNVEDARALRGAQQRRRLRWKLSSWPSPRPKEWASYRGDPGRSAHVDDGPAPPLGLRWQFKTEAIIDGSPAVTMGRVFFGTMRGAVHCLDAFSGHEYWKASPSPEGIISSPAVFEGRVYIGTGDGDVCSFDARSGAEQWRFSAGSEVKASPCATAKGVVAGATDGDVVCLDASGRPRWTFAAGGPLISSPAVLDNRVYVSAPGWLYCLSLDDGKLLWRQPRGYDEGNILAVTPVATESGVYVAGSDAPANAKVGRVHCFDRLTGQPRWVYDWPSPSPGFQSSPAIAGQTLVIGGMDGLIVALREGRQAWVNTDLLRWWILASPSIGSEFVYLPVNDGSLHCLSLATGQSLWKTPLDAENEGASSSPALAYRRLYVGTSRNGMVCFGETEDR